MYNISAGDKLTLSFYLFRAAHLIKDGALGFLDDEARSFQDISSFWFQPQPKAIDSYLIISLNHIPFNNVERLPGYKYRWTWHFLELFRVFSIQIVRKKSTGLIIEEAGPGSGGRGKSEIFPALRMCSKTIIPQISSQTAILLLILIESFLNQPTNWQCPRLAIDYYHKGLCFWLGMEPDGQGRQQNT